MAVKTFLTPTYHEAEVAGELKKFYAISLSTAFKLRAIGKPLARALTALFQGVGEEQTHIEKVKQSAAGDYERETIDSPIDPKLAEVKIANREKTIDGLVDAFLEPSNGEVLAIVCMDSMRDDFSRDKDPGKDEIKAFLKSDVVTLKQILAGVAKANEDAFGPLTEGLRALRSSRSAQAAPTVQPPAQDAAPAPTSTESSPAPV